VHASFVQNALQSIQIAEPQFRLKGDEYDRVIWEVVRYYGIPERKKLWV